MALFFGERARQDAGHGAEVPAAGGAASGGCREASLTARAGGHREASAAAAPGGSWGVPAAGGGGGEPLAGGVVPGARDSRCESRGVVVRAAAVSAGDQSALDRGDRAAALGRYAGRAAE